MWGILIVTALTVSCVAQNAGSSQPTLQNCDDGATPAVTLKCTTQDANHNGRIDQLACSWVLANGASASFATFNVANINALPIPIHVQFQVEGYTITGSTVTSTLLTLLLQEGPDGDTAVTPKFNRRLIESAFPVDANPNAHLLLDCVEQGVGGAVDPGQTFTTDIGLITPQLSVDGAPIAVVNVLADYRNSIPTVVVYVSEDLIQGATLPTFATNLNVLVGSWNITRDAQTFAFAIPVFAANLTTVNFPAAGKFTYDVPRQFSLRTVAIKFTAAAAFTSLASTHGGVAVTCSANGAAAPVLFGSLVTRDVRSLTGTSNNPTLGNGSPDFIDYHLFLQCPGQQVALASPLPWPWNTGSLFVQDTLTLTQINGAEYGSGDTFSVELVDPPSPTPPSALTAVRAVFRVPLKNIVGLEDSSFVPASSVQLHTPSFGAANVVNSPRPTISTLTSADGVPPRLVSFTSRVGATTSILKFSETVIALNSAATNAFPTGCQTLPLAANKLTGGALSGKTLTFNNPAWANTDFNAATGPFVLCSPVNFVDAAGNAGVFVDPNINLLPALKLFNDDNTAPIISTVETVDSNTDGNIDALRIKFTEPLASVTGSAACNSPCVAGAITFSPGSSEALVGVTGVTGTGSTPRADLSLLRFEDLNFNQASPFTSFPLEPVVVAANGNLQTQPLSGGPLDVSPTLLTVRFVEGAVAAQHEGLTTCEAAGAGTTFALESDCLGVLRSLPGLLGIPASAVTSDLNSAAPRGCSARKINAQSDLAPVYTTFHFQSGAPSQFTATDEAFDMFCDASLLGNVASSSNFDTATGNCPASVSAEAALDHQFSDDGWFSADLTYVPDAVSARCDGAPPSGDAQNRAAGTVNSPLTASSTLDGNPVVGEHLTVALSSATKVTFIRLVGDAADFILAAGNSTEDLATVQAFSANSLPDAVFVLANPPAATFWRLIITKTRSGQGRVNVKEWSLFDRTPTLPSFVTDSKDKAAPVLLSAVSTVGGSRLIGTPNDLNLYELALLTFSESVSGAVFTGRGVAGNFVYGNRAGGAAQSVRETRNASALPTNQVQLLIDGIGAASYVINDFKSPADTVQCSGAAVADDAGNACVGAPVALTNSDQTAPLLLTAVATGANGFVTTITLTFNEAMAAPAAGAFRVSWEAPTGCCQLSGPTGPVPYASFTSTPLSAVLDAANNARIILDFGGANLVSTFPNSGHLATITFNEAGNDITDINGNKFVGAPFVALDQTGPALVAAVVDNADGVAGALFLSEPLPALAINDLQLSQGAISQLVAFGAVGGGGASNVVRFTLAPGFLRQPVSLSVNLKATVVDAVANPAVATAVAVNDFRPIDSVVLSTESCATTPCSGKVEQIRLAFAKPVFLAGAPFAVAGYAVGTQAVAGCCDIVLTVTRITAAFDGGDEPLVSFATGSGSVQDAPANLFQPAINTALAPFTNQPALDRIKPLLLSALALGGTPTIQLEFSEPLNGAVALNQLVASGLSIASVSDADASDRIITVVATASVAPANFGVATFNGVAVQDVHGNVFLDQGAVLLAKFDTVAPSVVSALSQADGTTGLLAFIAVTTNEPALLGSVSLAGQTVTSVVQIGGTDGFATVHHVNLFADEATFFNTGLISSLAFTGIVDPSGNDNGSQSFAVSDGSAPVLVFAGALAGEATVLLKFSERIVSGTATLNGVGPLPLNNFQSNDNVNLHTALLQLGRPVVIADFGRNVVAAALDAAGLATPNLAVPLINLDVTPPAVVSLVTVDGNANGFIEALLITFDKDVNVNNLVLATSDGVASTSAPTATTLLVTLPGNDATFRTDVTPVVTYTSGIATPNNVALPAFVLTARDAAGPVILSAVATILKDRQEVTLVWSEPVDTSSSGNEAIFPPTDIGSVTAAGAVNTVFTCGDCDASDRQATFLTTSLVVADLTAMVIFAQDNQVFDNAGNAALSTNTRLLVKGDVSAPTLVSATSRSSANNGVPDGVLLTFSEDMRLADFALADFGTVNDALPSEVLQADGTAVGANTIGTQLIVNFPFLAEGDSLNISGLHADLNGNALVAPPLAIADRVRPVLALVIGAGGQSSIRVTFTEPIVSGLVGTGPAFALQLSRTGGGALPAITAISLVSGAVFDVALAAPLVAADLGTTLFVQVAAGASLADADGNLAVEARPVLLNSQDTTRPDFVSCSSISLPGEGRVSRVEVVFSEAILDSSVNPARFSIGESGFLLQAGVLQVGAPNDASLVLAVAAPLTSSTDATVTLSLLADQLSDLSGNLANAFTAQLCLDRAAPVLGPLVGSVGVAQVSCPVSEPIFDGESGPAPANFVVRGVSGTSISAVAQIGANVVFTLDRAVVLSDFGLLAITASGQPARDVSNNPLDADFPAVLQSLDVTPPSLLSARTLDVDGNSQLDGIELTFSEAIAANSLRTQDWTVSGGYTVVSISLGATSSQVLLVVGEAPLTTTDITPVVAFVAGGTLADINGNTLAPVSVTATDAIPPLCLAAVAPKNGFEVSLTFSEAVVNLQSIGLTPANIGTVLGFAIETAPQSAVVAPKLVGDVDGRDAEVSFVATRKFTTADFGVDVVVVLAGKIVDLANNPNAVCRLTLTQAGEASNVVITTGIDKLTQAIIGGVVGALLLLSLLLIVILCVRRHRAASPPEHLDAKAIMSEFDLNKDGVIDATELQAFVLAQERKNQEHAKTHGETSTTTSPNPVSIDVAI